MSTDLHNATPSGSYALDCDDIRRLTRGPVYCEACGKRLDGLFSVLAGVPLCDDCGEEFRRIEAVCK